MTIKIEYYPHEITPSFMQELGFTYKEGEGLIVTATIGDALVEDEANILGVSGFTCTHLKLREGGGRLEDYTTKQDILDVINLSTLLLCEEYLGLS